MNPDRWPEVERLYEQVVALPTDRRAAFLDETCVGDDDLRREVDGLLNLEPEAKGFLEQPALRAAANTLSRALPHLKPPDVPGYWIIREVGEGGMGVVYLAEQLEPLRRSVALKLIRPGMDSRQVLARFERERQALARMDHPNIAAVFDAGSTADGRPYFVMEFVDGVSITEYCDSRQLSIRARLSLFIQVCNAVQHAHQKGVIHRDLKPSNVLVMDQDGQPVPKIIDFGTAKAADPTSEATLTTDGLVFGTVEYMSPEQAAFSSDIDTTTDVYSLGVLLYELLVGCTPFDRHKVETNGLEAVLGAIRDSDPPRPSSLISRKDFLSSVAARATDAGVLAKQLSGDLDWIVLKALEKDRSRRYSTAASLGADAQRFLDSKPIEARPPSVPYRVRKFTRRYRGAVTATVAIAVTLIVGLIASTTLYWRAERNRDEAEVKTYAATIAAADAELRAGLIPEALDRLARTAPEFRDWEWSHLLLRADGAIDGVQATPACEWPNAAPELRLNERDQSFKLDLERARLLVRSCDRLGSVDLATFTYRAEPVVPGELLLAAGTNGTSVRVPLGGFGNWKLNVNLQGGEVVRLGPFEDQPRCAALSPNSELLAVGFPSSSFPFQLSSREHFELWNLRRRERVNSFESTSNRRLHAACRIVFSDDGRRLATSASDVWMWDIATAVGNRVHEVEERGLWRSAPVAFDPSAERLAIGLEDGSVDIVTLATRGRIRLFAPTGKAPVFRDLQGRAWLDMYLGGGALNFTRDGKSLISAVGAEVNVWDTQASVRIRSFRGHRAPVVAVVEGPNADRVYSQDSTGVIQAWTLDLRVAVHQVDDLQTDSVILNQNGSAAALVRNDSSLYVMNLLSRQYFDLGALRQGVRSSVTVSPSGQEIAVVEQGLRGPLLRRSNVMTGASEAMTDSNDRGPCPLDEEGTALANSMTPTELVILSNHCVSVRDLATLRVLATLRPDRSPTATALTKTGNLLVAVSSNETEAAILVWDWRRNRVLRSVLVPARVRQIVTDGDGSTIAALTGRTEGEVVLWDMNFGHQFGHIPVYRAAGIALNEAGTRLAVAHSDNAVRIWDAKRLVELLMLTDTDAHAGMTVFTADGRLVTTRDNKGITIWDSRPHPSR